MIPSQLTPCSPRRLLATAFLSVLVAAAVATPIQPLQVVDDESSSSSSSSSSAEDDQTLLSPGEAQLPRDFPDPTIVQDSDSGDWYSFATNGNGKNVQMARAPNPLGPWEWINEDAMPDTSWTTGRNTWAPDVRRISGGSGSDGSSSSSNNESYILYFAGEHPSSGKHCIGVATSPNITGPYDPQPAPWACHLDDGGAIDAAGFLDDASGRRYVSYKIDGNHIGNGGDCGNGNEPIVSTPIMLQEVDRDDGHTKIGDAVEIFDRTEADGPLVEAPDIVRIDVGGSGNAIGGGGGGDDDGDDDDDPEGIYVLFFSSFCYTSERYNVNYAVSTGGVTGPYQRADEPLLVTGNFDLLAPGGATSVEGGGFMVFHADCDGGRCLHATRIAGLGSSEATDNEEPDTASTSASASASTSPSASFSSAFASPIPSSAPVSLEFSSSLLPLSSGLPGPQTTASSAAAASDSPGPTGSNGSGFREEPDLDAAGSGSEGGSEADEDAEEPDGAEGSEESDGSSSGAHGLAGFRWSGITATIMVMAVNNWDG